MLLFNGSNQTYSTWDTCILQWTRQFLNLQKSILISSLLTEMIRYLHKVDACKWSWKTRCEGICSINSSSTGSQNRIKKLNQNRTRSIRNVALPNVTDSTCERHRVQVQVQVQESVNLFISSLFHCLSRDCPRTLIICLPSWNIYHKKYTHSCEHIFIRIFWLK